MAAAARRRWQQWRVAAACGDGILHVMQPQQQPPPFISLPPILAPAANTGVLFNHGVHEATANSGDGSGSNNNEGGGDATAATRRQQRDGSDATAAGIDTDNNQLVPP
jgi:hypothetical protein